MAIQKRYFITIEGCNSWTGSYTDHYQVYTAQEAAAVYRREKKLDFHYAGNDWRETKLPRAYWTWTKPSHQSHGQRWMKNESLEAYLERLRFVPEPLAEEVSWEGEDPFKGLEDNDLPF